MLNATSNKATARYNDEVVFLDGIFEFHPEVIRALAPRDLEAVKNYYLIGQPVPENIFEHRQNLLHAQPGVQPMAELAFKKILATLGIDEFTYSTKL